MKNVRSDRILSACILVFAGLRLIGYFVPFMPLTYFTAALLAAIVLWSVPLMKRATQIVLLVLSVAGVSLLLYAHASFETWAAAVLANGNMVMLLMLVPMISAPFFYEDYQSALKSFAEIRMRNVMSFLLLISVCTHVLAVIVSIGAVMIIYELMEPFARMYRAEKPFLTTVSRAYNSSGFWSPAWASVIVYSAYPDVRWVKVIPVGIAFTVLFILLHLAGAYLETRRHPDRYPDIAPDPGVTLDSKRLTRMLLLAVCMIGSIILVNVTTGWDLMISVSVVSLLFPLIVALVQNRKRQYRAQMKLYYDVQIVKSRDQVALFMLSGFLGKALAVSGVGQLLSGLLPPFLTGYPALMVAALMLLLILPGMAGVHPAATGSAMLAAFSPAALGLTHYTFALAMLVGWLLTIMMAPYSATGLLLSSLTGKNNYYTSIGINWAFCIVCIAVFSPLIALVGPLMG